MAMKPKLILCLALVLCGNCHAAIVDSLATNAQRQILSTNIDLKTRCYEVSPTNLASGVFLSKAQGLGELSGDAFDSKIPEALQIAEQLPQVKKQDYEPRLLDCSPLLFVAVWLHGKSDDIIIPLPPTFGRWNAMQPYSESQMIKLLKPEANKKLKMIKESPPGVGD
jgi:hypothetical protein